MTGIMKPAKREAKLTLSRLRAVSAQEFWVKWTRWTGSDGEEVYSFQS
jgi:hypothetical protein